MLQLLNIPEIRYNEKAFYQHFHVNTLGTNHVG
ncbi:Uncharacterised protein [Neisseria animaloris]|uniref:Uncharacterized protein n=1 Tax=Neisseria animaloris TaxID=326522 RepID=A0A448UE03_9NEIS|nr:Uncharacterised protein [Neisseria animaloris]